MKHIGILTFPHSPSFGASLQMLALYETLKQEGYKVDVLNYMNIFMQERKHISGKQSHSLRSRISNILDMPSQIKFNRFEKQLSFVPNKLTNDSNVLKATIADFDKIICGSDQVWNPNITGGDMTYFLDFCKGEQRVAYAPSFGISDFSDDIKAEMKKELIKFSALSIREKQGVDVVRGLIGETPTVVIDPTMLQTADFWREFQKKPKGKKIPQKYIAVFLFNQNKVTDAFLERLEKETGLSCIKYTWSPRACLTEKRCVGQFGPREWLWFIGNASYVVTDSFHGSVFSILFEKKMFVSPFAKANYRLENLLSEFELTDRMMPKGDDSVDLLKDIDYRKVNEILSRRKMQSKEYLLKSIEGKNV